LRTLAIDLGTKRVGIALSDAGGKLATPLEVLMVTSPRQAMDRVIEIINQEAAERILVGVPLNMDDSFGPAANEAMRWGNELARRTTKPVIFVDERLSSFAAEQGLIDRKRRGEKITRKSKKSRLDALAAAGFLQAYLDGKLQEISS
jgi:putative Holliday junction resolvase